MKADNKSRRRQRLWRGLTTLTASVLALAVAGSSIVNGFRTDIDKFLGTTSTRVVTEDAEVSDIYTYSSDYSSTTELVKAIADVGERMSEEGTVLLKNNGALPLSADEKGKISLLGFSSYNPCVGGVMGSSLTPAMGTEADTVDFVGALTAKGFTYNPTLADMYNALLPTYQTEVQSWGGTITYNTITAPANSDGSVFTSKEPSQSALDGANGGWKDSMNDYNVMIVTIARAGSENANYTPGQAGVDPAQNLNQTDPLGLSDDERQLIQAAIDQKAANGGKVIVLLNNASAMEVQELQDNEGIDAMLQIGLPGGYGFYGVCDILDGTVNPSGHLSDTYAVQNSLSPAAQNYGFLMWANAQPEANINSAIVEAEGIYTGYRYYETRYADTVLGQGNADSEVGSTGGAWTYENEVTYPFGYGLSYTTFRYDRLTVDKGTFGPADVLTVSVDVTNSGTVAGGEPVLLFASDLVATSTPDNRRLRAFDKVFLQPGETKTVTFCLPASDLAFVGADGHWVLEAGDFRLQAGNQTLLVTCSETRRWDTPNI